MTSKIVRANGTVLGYANIRSCVYSENVNSGDDLRPGCVASASINVEVYGSQTDAPAAGEELSYYQVDGEDETLIGIFYADPSIATKTTYKFTAYDAVSKLDVDYSARLSDIQEDFPMTLTELVQDACDVAGVDLDSTTFPMSTMTVNAFYADNLTCRNILSYAAEIACKFIRCNTDGELVFDWYTTVTDYSVYYTGDNTGEVEKIAYRLGGLSYANYFSPVVSSVSVKPMGATDSAYIYPSSITQVYATDSGTGQIVLHNLTAVDASSGVITLSGDFTATDNNGNITMEAQGGSDNSMVISGNLLLTDAAAATYNAVAQNIYTGMQTIPAYRAATISLFPFENPFRAGQIVSVEDIQGVSFTTVIMSMTTSADSATISSSGKRSLAVQTDSNVHQEIANLSANIVQIDKLKVSWADIQEAIIQYLKLYGDMSVYTDDTLATVAGSLGYKGLGFVEIDPITTLQYLSWTASGIFLKSGSNYLVVSPTDGLCISSELTLCDDLNLFGSLKIGTTDATYVGVSKDEEPVTDHLFFYQRGATATVNVFYDTDITASASGWQLIGIIDNSPVGTRAMVYTPSDIYFTGWDFAQTPPVPLAMKIGSQEFTPQPQTGFDFVYYYAPAAGNYQPRGTITYCNTPSGF